MKWRTLWPLREGEGSGSGDGAGEGEGEGAQKKPGAGDAGEGEGEGAGQQQQAAGKGEGSGEPSPFPDDWRPRIAGEAYKGALKDRLDRMSSPEDVFKWATNAEKAATSKTAIAPPGPGATPEQVKEYQKAAGIPETPEGYLAEGVVQLPKGMELGEEDKPVLEAFTPIAHKANMTPAQVADVTSWYLDFNSKVLEAEMSRDGEQKDAATLALKKDWAGSDFERNMGAIVGLGRDTSYKIKIGDGDDTAELGFMDAILSARMPNGVLVGNDVGMLKALAQVAVNALPLDEQIPAGETQGSVADRLKEIRDLRKSDPDKYYANKEMQAEELRLIAVEQAVKDKNKQQAGQ